MSGIFAFLVRLTKPAKRPAASRPLCRMTEQQVFEIARTVWQEPDTLLCVHDVKETQNGVEWWVGVNAYDSRRFLRIDDSSGRVLENAFYPKRAI